MQAFDALLDWYEALTPQSLARIGEFYADGATFKDPFNAVRGLPAIEAIFRHMFEATEGPRFVIRDRAVQGAQAFATWDFEFVFRRRRYVIAGATHFRLDGSGKVIEHRDYWDAAEELWQKLPVLGGPVRWLRGQFRSRA